MTQSMALDGIRVLDLTLWQQGPMTTAMLADWGADVVKIEAPDAPDPGRSLVRYQLQESGSNAYFETHNRNKRAIALDLKSESGRDVFLRLARSADVVVQNFRPGVAERLKVDYEHLKRVNAGLIYCSASGFGASGPDAQRPALDPLAQARSGLMSVTGEPESPPTRTFAGFADQVSAFLLAYGIAIALFHRERTGEGQMVTGSLLQASLAVQAFNISAYLMTGTYAGSSSARTSRRRANPLWNIYQAQDGRWLMLAMAQMDRYWPVLQSTMKAATGEDVKPERITPEWLQTEPDEVSSTVSHLDRLFSMKPAAVWLELFNRKDMVAEVVQEYGDLQSDPQVLANGMLTELNHPACGPLPIVAPAVSLTRTPGRIAKSAPEFGQHTEEVLLEAGLSWEEVAGLRAEGAVGVY